MKKFAIHLIIAAIAIVGLCFSGCGGEKTYTDEQGVVYSLSDNKYTVTSAKNVNLASVEIPEKIDGKPVTALGNYVFSQCCETLKTVTLPDSIEEIGDYAFMTCKIDSITLPENLKSIGAGAFSFCKSLKEITLPDGVTELKDGTFSYCESLAKVDLPDSLVSVDKKCFANCETLQSITLPQKVETVEESAFEGCTKLSEIKLSANLTSIGKNAFKGCSSLLRVTSEGGQSEYFSMPQSVTEIGYGAFQDCAKLKLVNIPDNVTIIETYVFKGCTALETVTIGNKVSKIEYGAFDGCSAMKSIYFPVSLTEIEASAMRITDSTAVNYAGTEEQWDKIIIGEGNGYLIKSHVNFNSAAQYLYSIYKNMTNKGFPIFSGSLYLFVAFQLNVCYNNYAKQI